MIDDPELAALFRDEADEHLRLLESGLLHLEGERGDADTLEEVLREAHSLKGAARMLGLSDVELLSHALEDRLRSATHGTEPLTEDACDRLLAGVDALRALCHEALDDVPSGVDVMRAIADLSGESTAGTAIVDVLSEQPAVSERRAGPQAPEPEPAQSGARGPTATDLRIDTIRVAPRKLDALMNQSGELTVTRTRIARRQVEVAALLREWDELYQRQHTNRHEMTSTLAGADPAIAARLRIDWERAESSLRDIGSGLRRLLDDMGADSARLENVAGKLDEGIREARMLPLSTVFGQFHRMVRDIGRSEDKQIELVVEGGETLVDKRIVEEIKDPLMHLMRNAIDHGIETPAERIGAGKLPTGTIRLSGRLDGSTVIIEVSDDGRGLDLERIRAAAVRIGFVTEVEAASLEAEHVRDLVFVSGLSTSSQVTDMSGRGVGMDVVRANIEVLKGRIEIASGPGLGCVVTCHLPQALSTTRVLLVRLGGHVYGLPLDSVRVVMKVAPSDMYRVDGRTSITVEGEPVSAVLAADLLHLPTGATEDPTAPVPVVVLVHAQEYLALQVDEIVEEQEIVLKPIGALLKHVRNVMGAGILGTGDVCIVLSSADLVRSVRFADRPVQPAPRLATSPRQLRVLVVEDSATTRVQEKRILEEAGYQVCAAVDGEDAWTLLGEVSVDAVVSDVLMPNLDGFGLTERIRASDRLSDLPVVLVTTLTSDADRRKGLKAGANAYLTKAGFDQSALLETLARLVGPGSKSPS